MSTRFLKCLSCFGALSLLLSLFTARGDVLHVPQEYGTIQGALNAVAADDTVLISLGTYAEELSAPPLCFWLIGDVPIDTGDFERPTIDPSTLDSARWRHCLSIPAGCEPTVERMGFVNRAPMYPRPDPFMIGGVAVKSMLPATFRFCRFDSVYRAIVDIASDPDSVYLLAEDCRFLHAPRIQMGAEYGQVVTRRCYFQGHRCTSELVIGRDGSSVEECVFEADSIDRVVSLHGSDVLLRACLFGPIDTCAHTVLNVQSYGNGQTVVAENVFRDIATGGPDFATYWGVSGPPKIFRHNVLQNLSAYGAAEGTDIHIDGTWALIDSNLFIHCRAAPGIDHGKAIDLWNASMLTANRFVDMDDSTAASVMCQYASDGTQLRYNQFEASDYAVGMHWSSFCDAAWNYWGDSTGPYDPYRNPNGLGASVDNGVQFDPWCPDTNCFLSTPGIGTPLPKEFVLDVYPNPFNATLHLTLIPSEAGLVQVELFDVLGRRVDELWRGPLAFQKELTFEAAGLATGIYFARVGDVLSRKHLAMAKVVLLK